MYACLYMWLACLLACLLARLFVCLFVCLFGWLGGWLVGWLVCLSVCLSVSLFVCFFVCLFARLRRKGVWKGRLRKMRSALSKMRGTRLPKKFKARLVKNAAWAKCVYGAPLHDVCASSFRAWRSSTARAMGYSRSGESPNIALNLAGGSLDPQLSGRH